MRLLCGIFLSLVLLLLPHPAWPDSASLRGGIGGSVYMVQDTEVRMASETIDMAIHQTFVEFDIRYSFVNESDKTLSVTMGFPDERGGRMFAGWVNDFEASVDGVPVSVAFTKEDVSKGDAVRRGFQWHVYTVEFAPGEKKQVRNTYWTYVTKYRGLHLFEYVLHTGASWKGNIGDLTINATLDEGLLFPDAELYASYHDLHYSPAHGLARDGRTNKTWRFKNFEPTEEDDLLIFFERAGYPYMAEAQLSSSEFEPEEENCIDVSYGAWEGFDDDIETAWAEGVEGPGIGEWMQIDFLGFTPVIARLGIFGGRHNVDGIQLYTASGRIKEAAVVFSDGTRHVVRLRDRPTMQYFELPAIRTEWLRIEIMNVYPGVMGEGMLFDGRQGTGIAEVELYLR